MEMHGPVRQVHLGVCPNMRRLAMPDITKRLQTADLV